MAWQIIQQPNKKYCVFSTVVDHFIFVDVTGNDLRSVYKEEWGRQGVEKVDKVIKAIAKGEKPYHQFTQTFDEAVAWIKEVHGEFELDVADGTILKEDHFRKKGEKNESQSLNQTAVY